VQKTLKLAPFGRVHNFAIAEMVHHSELDVYQGRELDFDHEYTVFECGFEIADGEVRGKCRSFEPQQTRILEEE